MDYFLCTQSCLAVNTTSEIMITNFYLKVYNKGDAQQCPTKAGSYYYRKSRRFVGVMISEIDCNEKTTSCDGPYRSTPYGRFQPDFLQSTIKNPHKNQTMIFNISDHNFYD